MATVARPQTHKSYIDMERNEVRNLTLHNLASDPGTPVDGQILYRTDTDKARLRANGVWVDLATMADVTAGGISSAIMDVKGDLIVASAADTAIRMAAGANGTILVANSATGTGLEWRTLTEADIQVGATDRLLGRDTAAAGAAEEISVGGGIEFTGGLAIQTSAFTGDVTKTAGGTALTITPGIIDNADINASAGIAVTKLAVSATDRLLGRDTASGGAVEELTVGGGVEFTGTGGIQTSAFTGNVTKAAGGTALTIGAAQVTLAMMANFAANSIMGNNTGSPAAPIALSYANVKTALAYAASEITVTPFGAVVATNVQAALAELETDFNAAITAATENKLWKDPVRAASTGNLTLTAPGATIDGVTMVAGDRFLAKDQTSHQQDGIYIWNGAASTATRAPDVSTAAEANKATTLVLAGTVNQGDTYTQTATVVTIDTTPMVWTKSGEGNTIYTADGTTITLTGTQFAVTAGGIGATQLAAAVAGNGLTGGGGAALAVGAGDGITVAADLVSLATTAAGAGLTYTTGVLAVGVTAGLTVAADSIGLDTAIVTRKFTQTIGNGALTTFTITHNLNTLYVTWACFDVATGEEWYPDVTHASVNTLTMVFTGHTPTTNQFGVVVQG